MKLLTRMDKEFKVSAKKLFFVAVIIILFLFMSFIVLAPDVIEPVQVQNPSGDYYVGVLPYIEEDFNPSDGRFLLRSMSWYSYLKPDGTWSHEEDGYRIAYWYGPTVCGNRVMEGGEQCEDDNTRNGDGCSVDCRIEGGWSCEEDENGVSQCIQCELLSAQWLSASASEGTSVPLVVNARNCDGQQINFEVRENDLGGDDSVQTNPNPGIVRVGWVSTIWGAEYIDELGGDPEYYFYASANNNPSIRIRSSSDNLLTVTRIIEEEEGLLPSEDDISLEDDCSSCSECSSGIFDPCFQGECNSLGSCAFSAIIPFSPIGSCNPDPEICGVEEEVVDCGNSLIEGGEECDDGGENGVICIPEYGGTCSYCSDTCEIVEVVGSSCDDGIIQEVEECDGNNLGGATCQSIGYEGGTLACSSDCAFDTSGCLNAPGEAIVNSPPRWYIIDERTLLLSVGYHPYFLQLDYYVSDEETPSYELEYEIIEESNLEVIDCFVNSPYSYLLSCNAFTLGNSDITISVSDGEYSRSTTFTVRIRSCGEDGTCIFGCQPVDPDCSNEYLCSTNAYCCSGDPYCDYPNYCNEPDPDCGISASGKRGRSITTRAITDITGAQTGDVDLWDFPSRFSNDARIIVGSFNYIMVAMEIESYLIESYLNPNNFIPIVFSFSLDPQDNLIFEGLSPQEYNLILIGTPCNNQYITLIDETFSCDEWNEMNLQQNQALLRMVRNGERLAFIIGISDSFSIYNSQTATAILQEIILEGLLGSNDVVISVDLDDESSLPDDQTPPSDDTIPEEQSPPDLPPDDTPPEELPPPPPYSISVQQEPRATNGILLDGWVSDDRTYSRINLDPSQIKQTGLDDGVNLKVYTWMCCYQGFPGTTSVDDQYRCPFNVQVNDPISHGRDLDSSREENICAYDLIPLAPSTEIELPIPIYSSIDALPYHFYTTRDLATGTGTGEWFCGMHVRNIFYGSEEINPNVCSLNNLLSCQNAEQCSQVPGAYWDREFSQCLACENGIISGVHPFIPQARPRSDRICIDPITAVECGRTGWSVERCEEDGSERCSRGRCIASDCRDPDGLDIFQSTDVSGLTGSTGDRRGEMQDSCSYGDPYGRGVLERVCSSSNPGFIGASFLTCPNDQVCYNGECIDIPEEGSQLRTCVDSDVNSVYPLGNNPLEQGIATEYRYDESGNQMLPVRTYTDECDISNHLGNMLNEWVCNPVGSASQIRTTCPSYNYCNGGECIRCVDPDEDEEDDGIYVQTTVISSDADTTDRCTDGGTRLLEYGCQPDGRASADLEICNCADGRCVRP